MSEIPTSVLHFQLKELSHQATKYVDLCRGLLESHKSLLEPNESLDKCVVTPEGLVVHGDGKTRFIPWVRK